MSDIYTHYTCLDCGYGRYPRTINSYKTFVIVRGNQKKAFGAIRCARCNSPYIRIEGYGNFVRKREKEG